MPDSIEDFRYIKANSKGFTEVPKKEEQDSVRKARRSPGDLPYRKPFKKKKIQFFFYITNRWRQ